MTSSYQNWNALLQGSLTFAQMFVFHMWKETMLWLSADHTLKFCQAVKQTLYGSKILHQEQRAGGEGWGDTGSIALRNSLHILGRWQPCRAAELWL